MDDFEKELKAGFLEEAMQLLSEAEQCFLALESSSEDSSIIDKIFRIAHNLKGSSKAVGFDDLGLFTHEFETFLLKIKNGEIAVQAEIVSLLLECNDHIQKIILGLKADLGARFDSSALIACLREAGQGRMSSSSTEASAQPAGPVEASISLPKAPAARAKKESASLGEDSIRVSLARLEKLLNLVGELVILQTVVREQVHGGTGFTLRRTVDEMAKVTKEIQDLSMSLRMVPVKQTFQKMQRIVRDTAGQLGKTVNLVLSGEETELDKTVLESMGDPLVHLIRNAVDHGIELPELRKAGGKPAEGTVYLSAFHSSGRLVIEVRDDGKGIDPQGIQKKAIEKGILPPGTNLSDREAVNLIFHPGFSTKAEVTDVSGRGVGMDVVKTNIESLQGEVRVESAPGKGTTITVLLPLTLAIIDGMIVKTQVDRYVVPLAHVHETVRLTAQDIQFATGLGEILMLRGETVPLYSLDHLMGKSGSQRSAQGTALVIRDQGATFAVWVDEILGQYQVVIKKLGFEIQNLTGVSGSAILGDGKPALILELTDLIKQYKQLFGRHTKGATA